MTLSCFIVIFFSYFLINNDHEAGFNREHLGYYKKVPVVEVGTSRSYPVYSWEVDRPMSGNTQLYCSGWWNMVCHLGKHFCRHHCCLVPKETILTGYPLLHGAESNAIPKWILEGQRETVWTSLTVWLYRPQKKSDVSTGCLHLGHCLSKRRHKIAV